MKNGGGHFAPQLGGHFELESGAHFKLELGGQYHWNLHSTTDIQFTAKPDKPEGTLEELRNQNKINGFNYAWDQGMKYVNE